jgi:beta-glucosidase
MPWADKVSGIVEAFFPGVRGAEAIGNILFGEVNPSAKLPVTFAKSDSDLPHPEIAGMNLVGAGRGAAAAAPGAPAAPPAAGAAPAPNAGPGGFGGGARGGMPPFDVPYPEGVKVGYKWFDAENKEPLFAFGYGLSYTTFAYSGLKVTPSGNGMTVSFSVKNTGKRAGTEIAQVYTSLPANTNEPPKRLIGWDRVELAPGQSKTVTVNVDPLYLSIFNEQKDGWQLAGGDYKVMVGGSSKALPLSESVKMAGN